MGLFVSCCWKQVIKLFLPAVLVLAVFINAALASICVCQCHKMGRSYHKLP